MAIYGGREGKSPAILRMQNTKLGVPPTPLAMDLEMVRSFLYICFIKLLTKTAHFSSCNAINRKKSQ